MLETPHLTLIRAAKTPFPEEPAGWGQICLLLSKAAGGSSNWALGQGPCGLWEAGRAAWASAFLHRTAGQHWSFRGCRAMRPQVRDTGHSVTLTLLPQ